PLCDGYLRTRVVEGGTSPSRVFSIASRLPQELQMVLAARVFGWEKDSIPLVNRERGFRRVFHFLRECDKGPSQEDMTED
ncbi:MAG: hypothetical protein ACYCPS_06230, partial [Candidatus Saccharimonadales bacterium]